MRTKSIIFVSILIVLFVCTEAFANVNFKVNGSEFKPSCNYVLTNGVTYVEADLINKIIGADINVSENDIIVVKNNYKLQMFIGQNKAYLNSQELVIPAPYINNETLMLPLRAICEAFGVIIDWNHSDRTVVITYTEKKDNLTADELLIKTSQIMNELPSYTVNGDMKIKLNMTGIKEEGFPLDLTMSTKLNAYYKKQPLTVYTKQTVNMNGIPNIPQTNNMEIEAVLTDDSYYMNMPNKGWVKMDLSDMNLNELMQTYNSQNPAQMLQQMNDFGIISSFGNDVVIEGIDYWVVNSTIDGEKIIKEYEKILPQLQLPNETDLSTISNLASNINFNTSYTTFINTQTYMTDYIDMNIKMNMSIPSPEPGSTEVLDMKMDMAGRFNVSESSTDFELPDISSAVDLSELID